MKIYIIYEFSAIGKVNVFSTFSQIFRSCGNHPLIVTNQGTKKRIMNNYSLPKICIRQKQNMPICCLLDTSSVNDVVVLLRGDAGAGFK